MDILAAKKTIASYLTGSWLVSFEDLRRSCEVVQSDPEYVRYLRDELGLSADWISECAVFRAHVAEFCEMAIQEREREMPELLTHVEVCRSCRQTYWNVRPTWNLLTVANLKPTIKAIRKALTERLDLILDGAGHLYEQGLGPLAIESQPVAATLGAEAPRAEGDRTNEPRQKTWLLKDEEARCAIRLEVCGLESGEATARCWLEAEPPTTIAAEHAGIEVLDADSQLLQLSGRLSDYQSEPIFLSAGAWIIRLQSNAAEGVYTWDIRLEVHTPRPPSEPSQEAP